MYQRKDFLLRKLDEFFAVILKITGYIKEENLEAAEGNIGESLSPALIGLLLNGTDGAPPQPLDYDLLKFQVELLLLKLRVEELRGQDTGSLRREGITAVKRLISWRPDIYDIELHVFLKEY